MGNVKQVIVIRKDLNMRRGKEIAQGAHASMSWLSKRILQYNDNQDQLYHSLSEEELEWLNGSFAKICLQVGSERELMEIAHKAKTAGLTVNVITDAGKTEFNGVPTKTCLAIGPHEAEKIDEITSELKLY